MADTLNGEFNLNPGENKTLTQLVEAHSCNSFYKQETNKSLTVSE